MLGNAGAWLCLSNSYWLLSHIRDKKDWILCYVSPVFHHDEQTYPLLDKKCNVSSYCSILKRKFLTDSPKLNSRSFQTSVINYLKNHLQSAKKPKGREWLTVIPSKWQITFFGLRITWLIEKCYEFLINQLMLHFQ